VRGTSNFTDSHPDHQIVPPSQPKNYEDVERFSRACAEMNGLRYSEDDVLSGDAVLIKRALVERIGVLDLRFFGYFGDVDYGLRTQLAGFKLVCAKGAWLYHHGAGHVRRETERRGGGKEKLQAERMKLVEAGYQQFRQKWNITTPETYRADARLDFREIARARDLSSSLKYEAPNSLIENLEFH